jgi:hypothetical protein
MKSKLSAAVIVAIWFSPWRGRVARAARGAAGTCVARFVTAGAVYKVAGSASADYRSLLTVYARSLKLVGGAVGSWQGVLAVSPAEGKTLT